MILGQVSQPKHKSDLIKRFNQLKNVDFKMWEDVDRSELSKITNDISRYITNKEATIIVIKKGNKMKTFKMYRTSNAQINHFTFPWVMS